MENIRVTDTLKMSIPERIQLVEDIWDTIASETESIELTENEKKIIDERLEAYHKNPDEGSPWDEVYKRIVSKKNEI
jgi:putative addiction module component (TIGR02574 family)